MRTKDSNVVTAKKYLEVVSCRPLHALGAQHFDIMKMYNSTVKKQTSVKIKGYTLLKTRKGLVQLCLKKNDSSFEYDTLRTH